MVKKIDNLIRRIPDFYEPEHNPGRRDCMKGLSTLTTGFAGFMIAPAIVNNEISFDVGVSLMASGGVLFFGYIGKGIYKTIKSELNENKYRHLEI